MRGVDSLKGMGVRHRFAVSASETGHQELSRRAELGFAVVGPDPPTIDGVLDAIDQYVWSCTGVEVIASGRHWIDMSDWG